MSTIFVGSDFSRWGEAAMSVWSITGASGFLGRHLEARLLAERPEDVELIRLERTPRVTAPGGSSRRVDLLDRAGLEAVLDDVRPSRLFHLAGRTPPGDAEDFYRANLLGTIHLLDGLRSLDRVCRVVLVGSAAELGPVPVDRLPVGEDDPGRPIEAYGLSKWLATCAGLASRSPLEVVVGRVFNPIGPGMPRSQALGRFADELSRGSGPVRLRVGDLSARRDFVDARDVAGALIALGSKGRPGRIYHIGSGQSHSISEGLDRLIALSGREVIVEVDAGLASRSGPADSRADIGRIVAETGWSPRISWEQSLEDLWDDATARAGLTGGRPSV